MMRMVQSLVVMVALVGAAASGIAQVDPSAGMLRYPAVSAERIVFVYANDLWTVPREGGDASPP